MSEIDDLAERVTRLEAHSGLSKPQKQTAADGLSPKIVCPNGHAERFERSSTMLSYAVQRLGRPAIVNGYGELLQPAYTPRQPYAIGYKCLTCNTAFSLDYD